MAIDFIKNTDKTLKYLTRYGGFLTVKDKANTNIMAINWVSFGNQWGKPIVNIMVRKSRFTHSMLENSGEFTISIPTEASMRKLISKCGSRSGRDINKVTEFNIPLKDSKVISTPSVDGCKIYYECKVIYKCEIDGANLLEEINKSTYMDGDYHTLYCAEILNSYVEDK